MRVKTRVKTTFIYNRLISYEKIATSIIVSSIYTELEKVTNLINLNKDSTRLQIGYTINNDPTMPEGKNVIAGYEKYI